MMRPGSGRPKLVSTVDAHLAARIMRDGIEPVSQSAAKTLRSHNSVEAATGVPPIILKDKKFFREVEELKSQMNLDVLPSLTELHENPTAKTNLAKHECCSEDEEEQEEKKKKKGKGNAFVSRSELLRYSLQECQKHIESTQKVLNKARGYSQIPQTLENLSNGLFPLFSTTLFMVRDEVSNLAEDAEEIETKMKDMQDELEQLRNNEKAENSPFFSFSAASSNHKKEEKKKKTSSPPPASHPSPSPSPSHFTVSPTRSQISPSSHQQQHRSISPHRHHHHHHHHHSYNPYSSRHNNKHETSCSRCSEVPSLKKQIEGLVENEEKLLTRVKELEIDIQVKAHIVNETTAKAQYIFQENTVLREIAENEELLLRERDSLKNCVGENEELRTILESKEKIIKGHERRLTAVTNEKRKLANELFYLKQQYQGQSEEKQEEEEEEEKEEEKAQEAELLLKEFSGKIM